MFKHNILFTKGILMSYVFLIAAVWNLFGGLNFQFPACRPSGICSFLCCCKNFNWDKCSVLFQKAQHAFVFFDRVRRREFYYWRAAYLVHTF